MSDRYPGRSVGGIRFRETNLTSGDGAPREVKMLSEMFALVGQQAAEFFQLLRFRPPRDAEPEAVSNSVFRTGSGLGQDPAREPSSRVQKHRIVDQVQRLQRRVGARAAHASGLAAGSVENSERGIREDALPESV